MNLDYIDNQQAQIYVAGLMDNAHHIEQLIEASHLLILEQIDNAAIDMPTITEKDTVQSKISIGYVYLLQSPTNAYKIGRSKNPDNRLKTFEVKLPFEVEYIALIETNDMVGLERQLHEQFADKRINGEWFNLSEDDVQYIQGLTT